MQRTNEMKLVNQTQERKGDYMSKSEFAKKLKEQVSKLVEKNIEVNLWEKEESVALVFLVNHDKTFPFAIFLDGYYEELKSCEDNRIQSDEEIKQQLEAISNKIFEVYDSSPKLTCRKIEETLDLMSKLNVPEDQSQTKFINQMKQYCEKVNQKKSEYDENTEFEEDEIDLD